jgi:Dyp-type peroxidase family
MPIALDQQLRWPTDDRDMLVLLGDLQGNILKSHGRNHAAHLLLHFNDPASGRAFVRRLLPQLTSAHRQLIDADTFKRTHVSAGRFASLLLSATGYAALEIPPDRWPTEPAFLQGMQRRGAALADPPPITWELPYQQPLHALLIFADDSAELVRQHAREFKWAAREGGVGVPAIEFGRTLKNDDNQPIEHFGYVDGISVPVLIAGEQAAEMHWRPDVPLSHALAPDPGGTQTASFGSYMVFRKIEQNVRAFKAAEEQLASMLNLQGEAAERAGAMLIGRFEDGSPLALSDEPGVPFDAHNNFNYAEDPDGRYCPLHAHIRKVNPRGTSADERKRLLIRRGITYGRRYDDLASERDAQLRPSGGVGLLFMAYGSSIEAQFEYVQSRWANDAAYIKPDTGIDPIIGQQTMPAYRWPVQWGASTPPQPAPFTAGGFTTLKGGEYFFAPCLSMLASL